MAVQPEVTTVFDSSGDNTAQAGLARGCYLAWLEVTNPNNVDGFIQFFDAATGSVTVGTTTPKLSFLVPANGGNDKVFAHPIHFNTALTYACATTATGSGALATGLIVNLGVL